MGRADFRRRPIRCNLLAYHGWSDLAVLWLSAALAYGFVQARGAGVELAWLTEWTSRWRSKRSLRVVPRPVARRVVGSENIYESIDPLLDKINKSGYRQPDRERTACARSSEQLALNKSE